GKSGSITVQGTGEGLTRQGTAPSPSVINNNSVGLQVLSGKTLALVADNINIVGGTITAQEGQIELGSINSGFAKINSLNQSPTLDYTNTNSYDDITLSQTSLVNASGNIGGSISIKGRNIFISDGSIVLNQNLGSQTWGGINIDATESLRLSGTSASPNRRFFSTIRTESVGTGTGGEVNISTKDLIIEGGASIGSTTYNSVKSGSLNINSFSTNIIGTASFSSNLPSGIITNTASLGDTGNINISTNNLTAKDGGIITSLTIGRGNAGDILINASNFVELISSGNPPSYFASQAFNSGQSGSLTINAQKVLVGSRTNINTSTYGLGDAGKVTINASELEVSGDLRSSADKSTPEMQRFFNSPQIPSGSPGEVSINVNNLDINGGQVTVRNAGTGDAGTLSITAKTIQLETGSINATTTSGQGGDISLNARNISLNNGNISATAGGTGNGGNIDIDTKSIILQNNSRITANAFEGNGGNITIDTKGFFISPNSFITASSERGIDGTVRINSAQKISVDSINLSTIISQPELQKGCSGTGLDLPNQLTIRGKGGLSRSYSDIITGTVAWIDENAQTTNNLLPTQTEPSNQEELPISAQGSRRNPDGTISLTALPEDGEDVISQPSLNSTSSCQFKTSQQYD
ncbi:MAG TPA: hypothetical protein V6D25_02195, partial [Leptolyngbyaceae cyanobacterium]